MSIKMSVGLSKKVGLPAFSSLGASCQVECELEGSVLEEGGRFRQKAEQLFNACQQAIDEQLIRAAPLKNEPLNQVNGRAKPGARAAAEKTNEPTQLRRAQSEATEPFLERGLSERQLAFLQDLASQIDGLGIRRLPVLVALEFDKNLTELSSSEASQLIGLLRQVRAGKLALDSLLEQGEPQE